MSEYSPMVLEDIGDSRRLMTLDHSSQLDYIDHKSSSHMDTSRFGENFFSGLAHSGRSKLSYLIDPLEHVKTLKSPIRDRLAKIIGERCSPPPAEQAKLVRQVSPVHFGDAKRYDYLNRSKSPTSIRTLGHTLRQKSIRVLRYKDQRVTAAPISALMLKAKPQKAPAA